MTSSENKASQFYKVVLEAAAYATIPFILLGLGWLLGFVTRPMLDWNKYILLATFISGAAFCYKLIDLAKDKSHEVYGVVVLAIFTTGVFSFIHETADRRATIERTANEAKEAENKRKVEQAELQRRLDHENWFEKAKELEREKERERKRREAKGRE